MIARGIRLTPLRRELMGALTPGQGVAADELDVAAGDRRGDGVRSGLDPVEQRSDLLHDIDGMRRRGHSDPEIARKTGLSLEYVRGVLRLLTGGETRTIPVMIPSLALHTGTLWGQVAAASIIQSIPVLVFIFFIQRHLVRGLTFGAVKG